MNVALNVSPDRAAQAHGEPMRLVTLGGLALLHPSGEEQPLAGHKLKLAVLAILALSPGSVSREALIEMFWAGETNERARRHSLSNALSFLRRIIGSDAIATHRADVTLSPDFVAVDAVDLLVAARDGNHARVLELYKGPFLDGMTVTGTEHFDNWVETQRAYIERAVLQARNQPRSSATAVAETTTADRAQAQRGARSSSNTAATTHVESQRPILIRRVLITMACIAIIASAVAYALLQRQSLLGARPAIAVTDVVNVNGDTTLVWLEDGIAQMITADMLNSSGVRMIGHASVRAARASAQLPSHGRLSSAQALELGQKVGASTIVRGSLTRENGSYVLDITTQDVRSGRTEKNFGVAGADPFAIAASAAGRLLDRASGGLPRR